MTMVDHRPHIQPLSADDADGMIVELVEMSPEWAAQLLEYNLTNRPLRPNLVDRYAREMRAGNWLPGVGSISLDKDGSLLNGQHRLNAVVESGVTIRVVLVMGATALSQRAEDTGLKRSLGDLLAWSGEPNSRVLAASLNFGCRWSAGTLLMSNLIPTHTEALQWYEANPGIRAALGPAMAVRRILGTPIPAVANWAHRVAMIDPDELDRFLAQVISGAGLESGSPVLAYRSWALNQKLRTTNQGKASAVTHFAILVKAWNAWITGRSVQTLVWRRGGSVPEGLPEIVDASGTPIILADEVRRPG